MTAVALVTGGTRGIGRAITERLLADGCTVAAAYAGDAAAAAGVREKADSTGHGDRLTLHAADLADPDACGRLVHSVVERHGRVDHLVSNAGYVLEERLASIAAESWSRQLDVNLSASFFLAQAVLPGMVSRGSGRIVNIGSVSGHMGSPVQIAYAAAKAGLVGLTRSLARSVARKGVTVNCVVPGSFDTELSQALALTNRELVTGLIPVGRWGRPEELAHAVAMLLDERASYITGAVLTVDGGMSMGA